MVKNPPASAGDWGSIPGLEKSPGGGHGNPLQYSCLGHPMDRGAWRATVHGGQKKTWTSLRESDKAERLSLINRSVSVEPGAGLQLSSAHSLSPFALIYFPRF